MMKTIKVSVNDYRRLAELLSKGEVVGFPTETVYGLGVVFDNEKAYQKLMDVKNRPEQKPFTLMCDSVETIHKYAFLDSKIERLLKHFMPGALTVLLKAKPNLPFWVTMGSKIIGVRISSLPLVNDIIAAANKPLLVPSANKSGKPPLIKWEDVEKEFDNEIAGLIEMDALGNLPSTIIEIRDTINLVRQGSIPFAEIIRIWEDIA